MTSQSATSVANSTICFSKFWKSSWFEGSWVGSGLRFSKKKETLAWNRLTFHRYIIFGCQFSFLVVYLSLCLIYWRVECCNLVRRSLSTLNFLWTLKTWQTWVQRIRKRSIWYVCFFLGHCHALNLPWLSKKGLGARWSSSLIMLRTLSPHEFLYGFPWGPNRFRVDSISSSVLMVDLGSRCSLSEFLFPIKAMMSSPIITDAFFVWTEEE